MAPSLWTSTQRSGRFVLEQRDPSTGKVQATHPFDGNELRLLCAAPGQVWVENGQGAHAIPRLSMPQVPAGVVRAAVTHEGEAWLAFEREVARVYPANGPRTGVSDVEYLAASQEFILAGSGEDVVVIERATGHKRHTVELDAEIRGLIWAANGGWAVVQREGPEKGAVVRIEPSTGRFVAVLAFDEVPTLVEGATCAWLSVPLGERHLVVSVDAVGPNFHDASMQIGCAGDHAVFGTRDGDRALVRYEPKSGEIRVLVEGPFTSPVIFG